MSVVSEITRIKSNITNAYSKCEEKGAELPEIQNSENLASTIESIPQDSESWQPEEDWYDIDSILQNDTEDCEGKMICLLSDSDVVSTINRLGANKIVTSDGAEYTDTSQTSFEHTWNTEYDKPCHFGYKTRYIIYYYSSASNIYFTQKLLQSSMFVILQNINYSYHPDTDLRCPFSIYGLQSIVFRNCNFLNKYLQYDFTLCRMANIEGFNCTNIEKCRGLSFLFPTYDNRIAKKFVEEHLLSKISDASYLFAATTVYYVPYIDTSDCKNFNNCFSGSAIRTIESLDFNSATAVANMFNQAYYIININNISNIKISGINISPCVLMNYDTLIRFIDALEDYSEDTSGTIHNIVFGPTLLAKLTDEDKARIVLKGWTAS